MAARKLAKASSQRFCSRRAIPCLLNAAGSFVMPLELSQHLSQVTKPVNVIGSLRHNPVEACERLIEPLQLHDHNASIIMGSNVVGFFCQCGIDVTDPARRIAALTVKSPSKSKLSKSSGDASVSGDRTLPLPLVDRLDAASAPHRSTGLGWPLTSVNRSIETVHRVSDNSIADNRQRNDRDLG
jgi:hypothetical protein